tara:strand:- start:905 stop:1639 length:735 start_codon:yes stop_codon:yes gene_type:complete
MLELDLRKINNECILILNAIIVLIIKKYFKVITYIKYICTIIYLTNNNKNMYTIPLFPLNMVVLPFEKVPLHIFEPRYKKMIDESLKNNTPFGIVSKNNGSVDSVGCSLKVTKVIKRYENGEYDLIATGDKCFQVIERSKINDLWFGNVEYMKRPAIEDRNILKSVQNKYLELLIKLKNENNFEFLMDKDISFQFLTGILLPIEIKRHILILDNETKRLIYINDLFKKILSQKIQNTENNFPKA